MAIRLKFWGTRGSIPRAASAARLLARLRAILAEATPADIANPETIDAFIAAGCRGALPTFYGGDTACVEVTGAGGRSLLIDLGSGAREYANHAMRTHGPVAKKPFHVLMSHFHWDHIMGFPFFGPAYVAGNQIEIYSCHAHVEEAFRRQHGPPSFPVAFDDLPADISFHVIEPETAHEINGFRVTPHALNHPGIAYGFRIEQGGRSVVYASDAEHKPEAISEGYPFLDFIRGADLVIFDAQYSLAETASVKEDWGHSSNVVGVELGLMAGIKRLVLFHHEPLNDDARLDEILAEARRIEEIARRNKPPLEIDAAHDGMVIEV